MSCAGALVACIFFRQFLIRACSSALLFGPRSAGGVVWFCSCGLVLAGGCVGVCCCASETALASAAKANAADTRFTDASFRKLCPRQATVLPTVEAIPDRQQSSSEMPHGEAQLVLGAGLR